MESRYAMTIKSNMKIWARIYKVQYNTFRLVLNFWDALSKRKHNHMWKCTEADASSRKEIITLVLCAFLKQLLSLWNRVSFPLRKMRLPNHLVRLNLNLQELDFQKRVLLLWQMSCNNISISVVGLPVFFQLQFIVKKC